MDRSRPLYKLEIDNVDIEKLGISSFIDSFEIEESDDMASTLRIVLANLDLRFMNDLLLSQAKTSFKLWLGYEKHMPFFDEFILEKPSYTFPGDGKFQCTLHCLDKGSFQLSASDIEDSERKEFKGMTYSQIAINIAKRFKLKTDIEDTEKVFEHTVSANESYMELLKNLAQKAGNFQIYIENNVLHFHKVKSVEIKYYDGKSFILIYDKTDKSTLKNFDISSATFGRGSKIIARGINPITKKVFEVSSTNKSPDETKEAKKKVPASEIVKNEVSVYKSPPKIELKQPVRYISQIGHKIDEDELKKQVEAINQANSWLIEGTGETIGLEFLRARKNVFIEGIAKFSGKYYLKSTRHSFSDAGYSTSFTAKTFGTEKPKPSKKVPDRVQNERIGVGKDSKKAPADVTDESKIVGEVSVYKTAPLR